LERRLPALLAQDTTELTSVVARCCAIKAEVVGQDEQESGLRAILNFGHTVGHAIEAITRYGRYLHGEAISIGQVLAARLSEQQLGFPPPDTDRLQRLLQAAGLPVSIRLNPEQRRRLQSAMQLDKKVSGGQIKFVLAERLGRVQFGCTVPPELVSASLDRAPRTRRQR
jgi:3-dehydroquinate synthase